MTTRRTLHQPALLGILAAAVLVACAVALLAGSREADATFPGKPGKSESLELHAFFSGLSLVYAALLCALH